MGSEKGVKMKLGLKKLGKYVEGGSFISTPELMLWVVAFPEDKGLRCFSIWHKSGGCYKVFEHTLWVNNVITSDTRRIQTRRELRKFLYEKRKDKSWLIP